MPAVYLRIAEVLSLVIVARLCCGEIARDNGFGSEIQWTTLKEGLQISKEQDKMLMLIIHKSWCGACQAFKPKFAASKEIRNFSVKFVMVNVEDDGEPGGSEYSPDGKYIPRIFFIEPNGDIRTDIYNKKGNKNYKYYYPDVESVLASMKDALIVENESVKEDF